MVSELFSLVSDLKKKKKKLQDAHYVENKRLWRIRDENSRYI